MKQDFEVKIGLEEARSLLDTLCSTEENDELINALDEAQGIVHTETEKEVTILITITR